MKWLGVVGTHEVNDTIRRDIEQCVGQKITEGGGIVTGGATGVDHEAARLAYEHGLEAARFRIFLPVELDYIAKRYMTEQLSVNVARMMRLRRSLFCETSPNIDLEC